MSKFSERIRSVVSKMIAPFSPHQYRLAQIKEYRSEDVEISRDFKDYAEKLTKKISDKCSKAQSNGSFDLYGFYEEWDDIDAETICEKIRLYRQYYDINSDHENGNAAARTRLHEIQHELAAAQAQLDSLYEQYLYSQTVYRRSSTDDTEDSADAEEPAGDSSGVPEYNL